MSDFARRLSGALYGGAIGDAMGAPVEGWPPERIRDEGYRQHDFSTFIAPTHGGDPATGKGDGRITDDTLMVEALIQAYREAGRHLDAYGYADFVLPEIKGKPRWIPERQREGDLYDRLWYPEQYPYIRLVMAQADPRSAGVGNCVNCGVAMWMMPAGAVNAGDPAGAYQEAAAIGCAHNESYAVEAGAVMAAAYAEALAPGASCPAVVGQCLAVARDGTHEAIAAAVAAADPGQSLDEFLAAARDAIAPFDRRIGHVSDDDPLVTVGVSDVGRPSRLASIEELPAALACLRYGDGDWLTTLRASVCYGRDCDSIAGMACGLYGALHGLSALDAGLVAEVDRANRRDYAALAAGFVETVAGIRETDEARHARRKAALA